MPTGPKIILIGNCQVTPLSTLLKTIYQIETIQVISAHLAQDQDAEAVEANIQQADLIITQHIHDHYPRQFLHTSRLKQINRIKVLTIPNLFYRGYTPDLRYVRLNQGGTLTGPLGDYHSSIILDNWLEGCSDITLEELYRDPGQWKQRYEQTAKDSMTELKKRELELDIKMSDFIEQKQAQTRLFHTFNHPSKRLLVRLAKRIGRAAQFNKNEQVRGKLNQINDGLNRIQIPIHPFVKQHLGLSFIDKQTVQSDHVNGVVLKQPQQFTLAGLIERFSLFYSAHPALMSDIRD